MCINEGARKEPQPGVNEVAAQETKRCLRDRCYNATSCSAAHVAECVKLPLRAGRPCVSTKPSTGAHCPCCQGCHTTAQRLTPSATSPAPAPHSTQKPAVVQPIARSNTTPLQMTLLKAEVYGPLSKTRHRMSCRSSLDSFDQKTFRPSKTHEISCQPVKSPVFRYPYQLPRHRDASGSHDRCHLVHRADSIGVRVGTERKSRDHGDSKSSFSGSLTR